LTGRFSGCLSSAQLLLSPLPALVPGLLPST